MARRVLVVDDSDLIREAAKIALGLAGWEVEAVASGEAALEAAAARPPDGIVLDVVMPGLDGPQTLARLREDPRTADVPVAFLTGQADDDAARAELTATGAAVIAKPFALPALAGQIRDAFGWEAP
ncbi:MAG TPA: response regulator [Capillimicrobium sp.]|jgi:CheY-like chemotaxis protein